MPAALSDAARDELIERLRARGFGRVQALTLVEVVTDLVAQLSGAAPEPKAP